MRNRSLLSLPTLNGMINATKVAEGRYQAREN
jgi:hypothetical protein